MAWKGFNNNKNIPSSDENINIQPNVNIEGQNYSEVKTDKLQSRDSGELIKDKPAVGNLPEDNVYKKVNAVRRDTDKQKDFSVSIEDIDQTIINFMDRKLNLTVMDNGALTKVPIVYATPERWYSVQKDGFLRDNQGKIMLPLIMIGRKSVENNRNLMTLNRYLEYPVILKYNEKNKYDRFDLLTNNQYNNNRPVKQVFNVKMPDHVIINYDCVIWTDYIDQNNKLIEIINFATHDYWGIDRFRFRTRIDNYSTEVSMDSGNDRNVKSTFDLIVNAYLLPNSIEGVKSTTTKEITYRKIEFDAETGEKNIEKIPENPYSYLKKYLPR